MTNNSTEYNAILAAVSGGILWAMSNYFSVSGSQTASKQQKDRALLEGGMAIFASVIDGKYVSPAICNYWKINDVTTICFIALMTGIFFWKTVPAIVIAGIAWVNGIMNKFAGGTK